MLKFFIASMSVIAVSAFAAEGPPTSADGTISNPTLVENSAIAKAQAVGVITTFMGKGAKECDADGKNCRSLFGQDDSLDYNSVQLNAQASSGVQAFSFLSGSSNEKMDTNTVSSQVGTVVLACGDYTPKTVSGVAVKLSSCAVTPTGDAKISYKTCTGPARGNPVEKPEKTMVCSTDPAAPNFRPKDGYSCERATCDGEPVGSLNGWSETQTVSYSQAVATSGSDDEKSKNGLGFTFYPALTGGVPASYTADSDNMVAVKIAQTAINNETKMTAVGLRVAFRHKSVVTKEMMIQGPSSVPDPGKHTASWDTILKLNGNALIPQYQQTYAANGSECMQQIQQGIAADGVISVCDPDYTNESGIRPGALTAQVASEGQACGTATQCLQEIVNTNTWEETCRADVPLAIRKCTTKQDYDLEKLSYVRTKTTEQCIEERTANMHTCRTYSEIDYCNYANLVNQGGMDMTAGSSDTSVVRIGQTDETTFQYRLGTVGDDYWKTGYYARTFTIDIIDPADVKSFRLYHVAFDDEMAISVNGVWLWKDWPDSAYDASQDKWGYWFDACIQGDNEGGCIAYQKRFVSNWERRTNWNYAVNVDMRPALKAGRNVIRIDTGVVGGGEGFTFFEISAWKLRCETRVVNECSSFEVAR